MSIEQIEQEIRRLPANDLVRLAEWFSEFLASDTSHSGPADPDWKESPELVSELNRRLEEYKVDPTIAVPFESDYFQSLKRQLADERAKKTSAR